jgi:hypothetical protein
LVQGGDDDIDALLAAMKVQDVNKVVIHDDCSPPSARSCACFVAHTTKVKAVRYRPGVLSMSHRVLVAIPHPVNRLQPEQIDMLTALLSFSAEGPADHVWW